MAKRLTKKQKIDILEGFRAGKSFTVLAKNFCCTPNTISRTVKSLLTPAEYSLLKSSQSKEFLSKDFERTLIESTSPGQPNDEYQVNNSFYEPSEKILSSDEIAKPHSDLLENEDDKREIESPNLALDDAEDFAADGEGNSKEEEINNDPFASKGSSEVFQELIPLVSGVEWEEQKEVACTPISPDVLPAVVYMLIDKKVELETKPLKDFSQWSFLPEKDQNRLAITLFSNQRSAKRSCSRNQRVLKVPNPLVFMLSSPFLLSKGISRLILDDSLIALDESN